MSRKRLEIRMVGNAHLDPAWMWEWAEGMEAFIATCRSALERMEETPGFVFTCSSAAHYAWIERAEPELFEQIRRRVDEGWWEIVGGWWTEADCNTPSGEGLIRQGELGQGWFREKFGRTATVGFSPDAFGHTAGGPQILRHVGLDSYIFCRPDPDELELPGPLFRWRSTAGDEVLAYRVPFHYNMYQTTVRKKVVDLRAAFGGPSSQAADGRSLHELRSVPEWTLFYGVGNHGGGPTREQIATVQELDRQGEGAVRFGRLDDFFAGVSPTEREVLPVVDGGLQMNSPGTYALHSTIKRLNRRSESELCRAESFDTLAMLLDPERYGRRTADVPSGLEEAWRQVCFNHFHDLLCGVAITDALENAVHRYGHALTCAEEVTSFALRSIARRLDTAAALRTIIVFNPHSFPVSGAIDFEMWHDIDKQRWGEEIDLRVVDGDGQDVVVQRIETRGKIGDDRVAGRFHGEIPPLGWRTWELHYGEKGSPDAPSGELVVTGHSLRNNHLEVRFPSLPEGVPDPVGSSPAAGGFISLIDRRTGLELIASEGSRPIRILDDTDAWGHGVERFDRESDDQPVMIAIDCVEQGEVSGTIRTVAECRGMRVTQWFTLHRHAPFLEVRCRVENREEGMVKLSFGTTLERTGTIAAAHYETARWPSDGRERPGGAWKGVYGRIGSEEITLGIADTLTHGYSAAGGDLRLSLFRATRSALHEPHPENDREDRRPIDIGTIEFRYRLRPVSTAEAPGVLERDALEVTRRPIVTVESPHPPAGDRLPREYAGIRSSNRAIVMTALRRNGNGSVTMRLFEASGEGAAGVIAVPSLEASIDVALRPHEVITLQLEGKGEG